MKRLVLMLALALTAASLAQSTNAEETPTRFGVSITETANNSGVAVTNVESKSPALNLIRVKDGAKLALEPKKHAISHVNGLHLKHPDQFVSAIAESPRLMTLKVYDYDTKAWDEYVVELRGDPTAIPTQPTVVYQQAGEPQYQQYQQYYTADEDDDRKSSKKSSSKKGGLFSAFNPKNYPQGDDWRPGDNVWLGQKKPTDPELRKAYNQRMFVEIVTGVAAGLDAAAGAANYRPSVPSTMGSHPSSSYRHDVWKADVINRYNTGKADWLRSLPD